MNPAVRLRWVRAHLYSINHDSYQRQLLMCILGVWQCHGGVSDLGFINNSLYQGDIDFQDIPGGRGTYWLLPLTGAFVSLSLCLYAYRPSTFTPGLTVQNNAIALPSGSNSLAAIDTGTTLVGGPPDIIAAMYEQIPGAAPGQGDYDGYYIYPCDTTVTVTMTFGGRTWPISPADFRLTQVSQRDDLCLGAFFQLNMGSGTPAWIVGDTFLVSPMSKEFLYVSS